MARKFHLVFGIALSLLYLFLLSHLHRLLPGLEFISSHLPVPVPTSGDPAILIGGPGGASKRDLRLGPPPGRDGRNRLAPVRTALRTVQSVTLQDAGKSRRHQGLDEIPLCRALASGEGPLDPDEIGRVRLVAGQWTRIGHRPA